MGVKFEKIAWLFSRGSESEHAGTIVILILLCSFFPILSLIGAWHVLKQ